MAYNTIHTSTCNYMALTRNVIVPIPNSTIPVAFSVSNLFLPDASTHGQRTLHVVSIPPIHDITRFYMAIAGMRVAIITRRPGFAYDCISDCNRP